MHPPDFDISIAWPFHPPSSSTPIRGGHNTLASQSELYASHSYRWVPKTCFTKTVFRLMLLEDMLASCKLQLEASLRANATANSEIHVTRDKMQKMMDENKACLDRAVHFETVSWRHFNQVKSMFRSTKTCCIWFNLVYTTCVIKLVRFSKG